MRAPNNSIEEDEEPQEESLELSSPGANYAKVDGDKIEERTVVMSNGVYRVTEVIGVSSESWEAAARSAVETAGKTVRDLRIAEVLRQDVAIENGKIKNYRVRLAISFKYEAGD